MFPSVCLNAHAPPMKHTGAGDNDTLPLQAFQTAKLIVKHLEVKFVLDEYIFSTISFLRSYVGLVYDPDSLRDLVVPQVENEVCKAFLARRQASILIPSVASH